MAKIIHDNENIAISNENVFKNEKSIFDLV